MKFMALALCAALMGCATTPPVPIRAPEPLTFERLEPIWQQACAKSVGLNHKDFCDCAWKSATQIYSAEEISHGLSNGPKIKFQLWRAATVVVCTSYLVKDSQ